MKHANDNHQILISINDVCSLTSLSRTSINKLRSGDQFPAEVSLGERRIAFVRTEVLEWIQTRVEARQGRKLQIAA